MSNIEKRHYILFGYSYSLVDGSEGYGTMEQSFPANGDHIKNFTRKDVDSCLALAKKTCEKRRGMRFKEIWAMSISYLGCMTSTEYESE